MSNEKIEKTPNGRYLDSYVSILKETLNSQIHSNISLQANNKLAAEMLQEMQKVNASLNEQLTKNTAAPSTDASVLNGKILELEAAQAKILSLQNEKNVLEARIEEYRTEYDSMRSQMDHFDTFKNQIVQLQQSVAAKDSIINNLTTQVNNLKVTPTSKVIATNVDAVLNNKDGGTF